MAALKVRNQFVAQRIYGHHDTTRHKNDEGDIDLFAVYCQVNDMVIPCADTWRISGRNIASELDKV
jgi:hypothetical protein